MKDYDYWANNESFIIFISEITNLKDKELNDFILSFKTTITDSLPFGTFDDYVVSIENTQIKKDVEDFFDLYSNKFGRL